MRTNGDAVQENVPGCAHGVRPIRVLACAPRRGASLSAQRSPARSSASSPELQRARKAEGEPAEASRRRPSPFADEADQRRTRGSDLNAPLTLGSVRSILLYDGGTPLHVAAETLASTASSIEKRLAACFARFATIDRAAWSAHTRRRDAHAGVAQALRSQKHAEMATAAWAKLCVHLPACAASALATSRPFRPRRIAR